MKNIVFILLLLISVNYNVNGQTVSKNKKSTWEWNGDMNFYLIPDNYFLLPVVRADKDKLHLEARYNYEDYRTVSGWIGYNLSSTGDLEVNFTPMLGLVIGNTNGIAPGVEFGFEYAHFSLYTESEIVLDYHNFSNDYIYNWTDFVYGPSDRFAFGVSANRTKLYHSEKEMHKGFLSEFWFKSFKFSTYWYNPVSKDQFLILSLSYLP